MAKKWKKRYKKMQRRCQYLSSQWTLALDREVEEAKEWESRAQHLREQRTKVHHLLCQAGIRTHWLAGDKDSKGNWTNTGREITVEERVEMLMRRYNELKQDVVDWYEILQHTMNGGGQFDQKGYLDKLSKHISEAIRKCQST
jgi:hypothetical protein